MVSGPLSKERTFRKITSPVKRIIIINREYWVIKWNVAVVHSIWERGLERDICALIREVKCNAKAAANFQELLTGSVMIGGSAAAVHLKHRYSFDFVKKFLLN